MFLEQKYRIVPYRWREDSNLTWINLRNTKVSDAGLKQLGKLQYLQYINLSGTQVSDKGISALASIKSLNEIYLWNSKVTESELENLGHLFPKLK